ncbi:hypothetical protein NPIL_385541 [Nephila pilipes]|uniref:Uncharacterized protein n=1 Tax=Nephila pilipes TaxID=299642 RepID=A0A8X6PI68_NEPPI|nr:hypothetical protein NPIL_385541 [Nephila pilipes]
MEAICYFQWVYFRQEFSELYSGQMVKSIRQLAKYLKSILEAIDIVLETNLTVEIKSELLGIRQYFESVLQIRKMVEKFNFNQVGMIPQGHAMTRFQKSNTEIRTQVYLQLGPG